MRTFTPLRVVPGSRQRNGGGRMTGGHGTRMITPGLTWLALAAASVVLWVPPSALAQQWQANGSSLYYNDGNVGIGSSVPPTQLYVEGNTSGSVAIRSKNLSSIGTTYLQAVGNVYDSGLFQYGSAVSGNFGATGLAAANLGVLEFGGTALIDNTTNNPLHFGTARTVRMSILGSGNVGIGTTNPLAMLEVAGNTNLNGTVRLPNNNQLFWQGSGGGNGFRLYQGADDKFYIHNGGQEIARFDNTNRSLSIGGTYIATAAPADGMIVQGNVGIGTSSPEVKLQVKGGVAVGSQAGVSAPGDKGIWLVENAGAAGTASAGVLFQGLGVAHGNIAFMPNERTFVLRTGNIPTQTSDAYGHANLSLNGNLGVGTANPLVGLHVARTNADAVLRLERAGTNASRWDVISSGDNLSFSNVRISTIPLFIQYNDNVGIGTSSPQARLHVAGDLKVDGNLAAKYQDVAEWVPTSETLKPGMVVVLDSQHANHVVASSGAYDTRVAGVVSDKPGILLGEAGDSKEKVATTGRVKVKADATQSPIKVGDLLVTGEKPGTAMASIPMEMNGRKFHQPGTILGKALEPLPKGEGEILVLLSLQ